MNEQERKNMKQKVDEIMMSAGSILLTSHMHPDPDAMCSTLAMQVYIQKKFKDKRVDVVFEGNPSNLWDFVLNADKVSWVGDVSREFSKYDLIILLDGRPHHRFMSRSEGVDISTKKIICIDHHSDTEPQYTLNIINSKAIATCELLYRVFFEDELDLYTSEELKILLIGILADSGMMKYIRDYQVGVLEVIGKLISLTDADLQTIDLQLNSIPKDIWEIVSILIANLRNLKVRNDLPGLSFSFLPKDTKYKYSGYSINMASNWFAANVIRRVNGFPWGFVATPYTDKVYNLSFRSTPGAPNVQKVAREFNGGGHMLAAGAKIEGENLNGEEVCNRVLDYLRNNPVEMEGIFKE